jgi:hypothetical protein
MLAMYLFIAILPIRFIDIAAHKGFDKCYVSSYDSCLWCRIKYQLASISALLHESAAILAAAAIAKSAT